MLYYTSRNFGDIFQESIKQKNSKSAALCLQREKSLGLSENLLCKGHVFQLRFVYSQAKLT